MTIDPTDFNVSSDDVQTAQDFLTAFLTASIPGGDFAQGSPLSDFVIAGQSYSFAYLKKQIQLILDRQSLLTIRDLPDSQSVSDAADAILDNFFRTRSLGSQARGQVTFHLSQRVDTLIRRNTRFFKTRAYVYYVDSSADVFIGSNQLKPTTDSNGILVDWVGVVNVVSARVGLAYNQLAGTFVTQDRFSPYLNYCENLSDFVGGLDTENTTDFIDSSRTAIALRAIINARSNTSIIQDTFPAISDVLTIGYGDPEMVRDVVTEVASGLTLHIGGFTDIYIRTYIQQFIEDLVIATPTPRADGRVITFEDSNVPGYGTFTAAGVNPGDILVIAAGLPEAPFQYVIVAVRDNQVDVAIRTPFSVATDIAGGPSITFQYTIGNNYPLYNNKVDASIGTTTADTTLNFEDFNTVILTGQPLYAVAKIEIISSSPTLDPYRDPSTGSVLFTIRSNAPITVQPQPGAQLSYFVAILNPTESQSELAINTIQLGLPGIDLTGFPCEVTYDTLAGFSSYAAYVTDPQNRPSGANTIIRGANPVYLSFTVPYALSIAVDPFASVPQFDPVAAASLLTSFVNEYTIVDVLDQSNLATQARNNSNAVAAIYPFTVDYDLIGPDGRIFHFQTQDRVTIFPDGITSTAILLNPGDFGLPLTNYFTPLGLLLTKMGISDRNARYIASKGAITFTQRF